MNEVSEGVQKWAPFFVFEEQGFPMTDFSEGVNVVTSSQADGTDRGKTVLLRSLYHALGADAYFDSKWKAEPKIYIGSDINKLNDRMRVLHAVQEDIIAKIGTGAYSGNIDALKRELKQHQREYSEIVDKLNKCKAKLFELRDKSYELTRLIYEVNKSERTNDVEIQQLRKHRCPECNSIITDTVRLKSKRFNFAEDIVIVRTEIETSLLDINQSIQTEEARYADLLTTMHLFEERVKMNSTEINDIVRYKGLCEIRDSVITERTEVQDNIDEKENTLKEIEKELKKYAVKKKKATDRYISILTQERTAFCIEEITIESIKKLSSVFIGSGSNKNISTIIWHMAIIQVRNEFNKDAIRFPFVIDSPNNVETDDEKKFKVIQYILDHASISPQMIMSAIGFVPEDYSLDDKSINIIYLGNEKWHLLNEQDYHQNYNLLKELSEAL